MMPDTDVHKCSIPQCARKCVARNLCGMHYARLRRNGDPMRKLRARGILDVEPYREPRPYTPQKPSVNKIWRQLLVAEALWLAGGEVVDREYLMQTACCSNQRLLWSLVNILRLRLKDYQSTIIITERNQGYRAGDLMILRAFLLQHIAHMDIVDQRAAAWKKENE